MDWTKVITTYEALFRKISFMMLHTNLHFWHGSSSIDCVSLWYGEPVQITKTYHISKSVDHGNKVMVRWHMSSWHKSTMINVCNEYGEPMLYGNRKKRTQPQKLPIVNTVATERQYICPDFSDFRPRRDQENNKVWLY
jgi:hypothetical protein